MKNRMNVPEPYEPVLPEKVKGYIEKKKTQASQDSRLTQTANAVGKVIGQMLNSQHRYAITVGRFDVRDLTSDEYRELKAACVNHLSHLIPDIEKETIE